MDEETSETRSMTQAMWTSRDRLEHRLPIVYDRAPPKVTIRASAWLKRESGDDAAVVWTSIPELPPQR
jgi:hypothetical protein